MHSCNPLHVNERIVPCCSHAWSSLRLISPFCYSTCLHRNSLGLGLCNMRSTVLLCIAGRLRYLDVRTGSSEMTQECGSLHWQYRSHQLQSCFCAAGELVQHSCQKENIGTFKSTRLSSLGALYFLEKCVKQNLSEANRSRAGSSHFASRPAGRIIFKR